jgi:hypothetical protein
VLGALWWGSRHKEWGYSLERERIDEKDLADDAMRTRVVIAEVSNLIVLTSYMKKYGDL